MAINICKDGECQCFGCRLEICSCNKCDGLDCRQCEACSGMECSMIKR